MSPFVSSFFKKCSIAVSYVAIPCIMSVLVLQSGATNVSKLCLGRVSINFFFFFGGTHMGCAGMSQLVYMVRRWSPVFGGLFPPAWYGIFGGKEICSTLKGENNWLLNSSLSCWAYFLSGNILSLLLSFFT